MEIKKNMEHSTSFFKKTFHFSCSKFHNKKGQFLIEALIAISILTVGFMAVLALLNRSLALNRVAADNYTASYLAAEGIEIVKNILDRNAICKAVKDSDEIVKPDDCEDSSEWNDNVLLGNSVQYKTEANGSLETNGNAKLSFNPNTHIYSYDPGGIETRFQRVIEVDGSGGYWIKVVSTVTWDSLGGSKNTMVLEDRFYNWRQ
jgi:type II secretory pathway component PulJ